MFRAALADSAIALAWRLWTELGVPGVEQMSGSPIIDPEPLVVWSPGVISGDPRLRDLVFRWCQEHGDRLSASRLRGLLKSASPETVASFGSFVTVLGMNSRLRWPGAMPAVEPWPVPAAPSSLTLQPQRPSLLRLRLRALAGVGTRSDVLCDLLGAGGLWLAASDLVGQGYTKRNIARVLAELESAGLVRSRADGNALRYQLSARDLLAGVVAAPAQASYPCWFPIFQLLALVNHSAARLENESRVVQRVEAHKSREQAEPLAALVGIGPPPKTAGNPTAFDDFMGWALDESRALADGSSVALAT